MRRIPKLSSGLVGYAGALAMKTLALACLCMILGSSAAHAAEDDCAVVWQMIDGPVVLRDQPNVRSRFVVALEEGDFVHIDYFTVQDWKHVSYIRRLGKVDGWVPKPYIRSFACEAGAP